MADPKYDTYFPYESLLMMRINDLDHAIQSGGDGVLQYSILWARLKTDIREPIQKQLEGISEKTEKDIEEMKKLVYNEPSKLGYPNNMSPAHKQDIINSLAKPINTLATLQMSQIVIDQLEKMGLLLRTKREVPQGNMPRIKDDTVTP